MSIEGYLRTRGELQALQTRIQGLSQFIYRVGSALNSSPDSFLFSNTDVALPASAELQGQVGFDGSQWPTAPQIMEIMLEYHRLKAEIRREWNEIPDNMRNGLIPPEPPRSRGWSALQP